MEFEEFVTLAPFEGLPILEFEDWPVPLAEFELEAEEEEGIVTPVVAKTLAAKEITLSKMPQTGVNDMINFWIIGICFSTLMSVVLLCTIIIYRKRKQAD